MKAEIMCISRRVWSKLFQLNRDSCDTTSCNAELQWSMTHLKGKSNEHYLQALLAWLPVLYMEGEEWETVCGSGSLWRQHFGTNQEHDKILTCWGKKSERKDLKRAPKDSNWRLVNALVIMHCFVHFLVYVMTSRVASSAMYIEVLWVLMKCKPFSSEKKGRRFP